MSDTFHIHGQCSLPSLTAADFFTNQLKHLVGYHLDCIAYYSATSQYICITFTGDGELPDVYDAWQNDLMSILRQGVWLQATVTTPWQKILIEAENHKEPNVTALA